MVLYMLFSCTRSNLTDTEKRYLISGSGNEKHYLIEIIRENQKNEKLGKEPMIIFNGEILYYHYQENFEKIQILKNEIEEIEIIEKEESILLFGSAGKFGLMRIKSNRLN